MLASPGPSWLQLLLASGWLDLVYVWALVKGLGPAAADPSKLEIRHILVP